MKMEHELRREREDLRRQLDALLTGAEIEHRDLSPEEAQKFDSIEAAIRHIDGRLERGDFDVLEQRKVSPEAPGARRDGVPGAQAATLGGWLSQELRALGEGGNAGLLVPPEHRPQIWERLAAESVGLRSGFTSITTDRDELHIPVLSADATAAWTNEGAVIAASDPTFAEVVARPRKLAALVVASNEVIDDSEPAVLDVVSGNLIRALALRLDLAFFEGSGTAPEPRGLKNIAGTLSVSLGANGAALNSLDPIADAIGALARENANGSAAVMHPRTWATLVKLKDADSRPLLEPDATAASSRRILGVPVFLSSQLSITEAQGTSSNASSIYVYEASEVIAVRRSDARVELDRSRLFDRDQSELRGILRYDIAVPNPAAICRIVGITP